MNKRLSDAQVFSVTHQLSGDPAFGAQGFAYVGNLLIANPDAELLKRLNLLARALTQAFGLVGLNRIDFVLNSEQVSILEVNPRYSASMELVEEALKVSLLEWHTAGCRRQSLPMLPERHNQNVCDRLRAAGWNPARHERVAGERPTRCATCWWISPRWLPDLHGTSRRC